MKSNQWMDFRESVNARQFYAKLSAFQRHALCNKLENLDPDYSRNPSLCMLDQ